MVTEQVGKVAHSTVDALKNQPAMLVLILLNVMMIGYLFFQQRERSQYERHLNETLVRCINIEDLTMLSKALQKPYWDRKELNGTRK